MKAKELIPLLQTIDPETEICCYDGDSTEFESIIGISKTERYVITHYPKIAHISGEMQRVYWLQTEGSVNK